MTKTPCKDCPDRKIGCHDSCKKYKESVKRNRIIAENRRKDSQFYGYAAEQSVVFERLEQKSKRK